MKQGHSSRYSTYIGPSHKSEFKEYLLNICYILSILWMFSCICGLVSRWCQWSPPSAGDMRDVGSIPGRWRRAWQPAPEFLPGESHGQRSLVGYTPQACKESDTTEATQPAHTHCLLWASLVAQMVKNLSAMRETRFDPWVRRSPGGCGNPLQNSCLENPMDRGGWWATVHRNAESDMTEVTQHAQAHTHVAGYFDLF